MPHYDYQAKDGETIERFYEMSKAPARIKVRGKTFAKVISGGVVNGRQISTATWGYPRVSNQLPKWLAGCKHDKKGRPIITSQRHERQLTSRHGLVKADLETGYNDAPGPD